MKVHLITVVGSHLDLLPHMLAHYRDCGIDSFFVNLQIERYDDPLHAEALSVCQKFGATLFSVYIGPWLHDVNTFLYSQARERYPEDWFVLADLDEFQVYPRPIPQFLQEIDKAGFDYVEGCIIDRIAEDGLLPEVQTGLSIWKQFPLAGMLTCGIARAAIHKVVAAKGNLRLNGGQHVAFSGIGCPRNREFIPVHHFKWTSRLGERLGRRVEFYRETHQPYGEESTRILTHFDAHDGGIDFRDNKLMIARCEKDYPYWSLVREQLSEVLALRER